MSDDIKKVSEIVEVLMSEKGSVEYQQFIDNLAAIYNQNSHKAFDKFYIKLEKNKEIGYMLYLCGERNEIAEEKKERELKEEVHRKGIEEAELKEYLRLKRKFGKDGQ